MAKKPTPTPIRFDPAIYYDYGISRRWRYKGLLLTLAVVITVGSLLSFRLSVPVTQTLEAFAEVAESVEFNLREDAGDMASPSSPAAPAPETGTALSIMAPVTPATRPLQHIDRDVSRRTADSTGPPARRASEPGPAAPESSPAAEDATTDATPSEERTVPVQVPDHPDMPAEASLVSTRSLHAA